MRSYRLYLASAAALCSLALIAHAQTVVKKEAAPVNRLAPAPAQPAAAGPSLEAQVAELRAQLDALRSVIEVDASGNVVIKANRDLVLKAGNVLDAYASADAKLRGNKLELESQQDVKLRGRNVRVDGSGDIDIRASGRVGVKADTSFDAEGRGTMTLRSSGSLDARAALIKLN